MSTVNKTFSFMVGIFTVLNTIQLFLFDLNQVVWISFDEQYSIFWEVKSKTVNWIMANEVTINCVLSAITMATGIYFLYCLHTKRYAGLVVYCVWIVVYELLSFSLGLLSEGIIKNQFKELIYHKFTFQIMRMLLHFLALPFIFRHMHSLYEDAKVKALVSRCRHSSGDMINRRSMLKPGPMYQHQAA